MSTSFKVIGSGAIKVLVLHGWGGSSDSWKDFCELAIKSEPNFSFIIPDLPGFGQTTEPNNKDGWGVSDYLIWVKDFLLDYEKKSGSKVNNLLTHSYGGRIAIKWLAENDSQFKNIILTAAAGIPLPKTLRTKLLSNLSKLKNVVPKNLESGLRNTYYKLLKIKDYNQNSVFLQNSFKKAVQEDLTPFLSMINQPVTLVWGREDSYTPLWQGELMQEKIANSELIILENTRHGIHLQSPDQLVKICCQKFTS